MGSPASRIVSQFDQFFENLAHRLFDQFFENLAHRLGENNLVHRFEEFAARHRRARDAQSVDSRPTAPWLEKCINTQYLQILDLSSDPAIGSSCVKRWAGDKSVTKDDLNSLSAQQPFTCRIYLTHGLQSSGDFRDHIASLTSSDFVEFTRPTTSAVQPSLCRRLEGDQMPWWYSEIHALGTACSLHEYKNLGHGALDRFIRSGFRIRFFWHQDGRVLGFILCEAHAVAIFCENMEHECNRVRPKHGALDEELDSLASCILGLDRVYVAVQAKANCRLTQQRIVMLRISHATLLGYVRFLSQAQARHSMRRTRPGVPTDALTYAMLNHISADSDLWEPTIGIISRFTASLASFLEILQLQDSGYSLSKCVQFHELVLEIRGISQDLDRRINLLSRALESRLKLVELGRSVGESRKTTLLSLVAIVYLPLALASAVLSMSTRVADLGYILYDFIGVAICLLTITGAIFLLIKTLNGLQGYLHETSGWPRFIFMRLWLPNLGALWALILASFLVGMVHDTPLGLRILGYGLPSFLVFSYLFQLVVWPCAMAVAGFNLDDV